MFCYENNLVYPVYVLNEKFENSMNLLMIADENKSILKTLTSLCAIWQGLKKKPVLRILFTMF